MLSAIKTIDDEQDTEITYCFGQELSENKVSIEQYMKEIEKVNKDTIKDVANKTNINTIYFLKN